VGFAFAGVLDGGLSTWLAAHGHDLSDELWSARLLADDPEAIIAGHLAFIAAGATVITTASYQATLQGLARRGFDGPRLLRRSVALAREAVRRAAVDHPVRVAASVGPYGAMLADGSEYTGNYGLTPAELARFHHDRIRILADAGPDVLALETVPDLAEAEGLLTALDGVGVPAWLSYTIDGVKTRAGQPLDQAFRLAHGTVAVGVNCCAPADVLGAVALGATVVYPNSGEGWDPVTRQWIGAPAPLPVEAWQAAGARLIGGCCRVTPAQIADVGWRRATP
jgi:homocysteine S-methyltransferase